jgi:hypothetical protein
MAKQGQEAAQRPPQHQERQPGAKHEMHPAPSFERPEHHAAGNLEDKVALITGGDSGIGGPVAVLFAKVFGPFHVSSKGVYV